MSSYIPQNTYVVCTFQLLADPRKLLIDENMRMKQTVIFKSKNEPLLVIVDKKINTDFVCKTRWITIVSYAAFGGGLAAGLLTGAVAIGLLVPGPGWAFAAVCVCIVAAAAFIGGLIGSIMCPTNCSDRLGSSISQWFSEHPKVTFDKIPAITKMSVLQCQEGGTLLPFISEQAAIEAANTISNYNITELAITGLVSFAGGFFTGVGLITSPGTTIAFFAVSIVLGQLINKGLDAQTDYIREESEKGSTIMYDTMNGNTQDANNPYSPDENWDLLTPIDEIRSIPEHTESQRIFDDAIQNREQGRSNSARNNPELNERMNSRDYRNFYRNNSGNQRGMNNPRRHAITRGRAGTRVGLSRASAGIGVVLLGVPFLTNWIGEKGREVAAVLAEQDLMNSISIYSHDH